VSGASIRLRARAIWKTTGKHLNPEANADHVRPRRRKNATTRDQTERQLYDSTAKKLAATHICYNLRELGLEHNLLCSLYDCKLRAVIKRSLFLFVVDIIDSNYNANGSFIFALIL
jgi:hypothetical protein